jgi:general secretion pathway protein J
MRCRLQNNNEAGFTLVELLVAFTLLTFVVVGLFGGLRFGFKVWRAGNARADHGQQVMVVQNFLRQVIGDVYPFFVMDDPTRGHVEFTGTANSLEFLSSAPVAFAHSGRLRFRLFLDRHGGRSDFAVMARPELADVENPSTLTTRALLSDVTSVQFSYFGKARADQAARWHDDWVNEIALPQLVRVRVPFSVDDERGWPELTIAPRLNVDEGCVYDMLTKQCQGR